MHPDKAATLWFENESDYSEYQKACAIHDPMVPFNEWTKNMDRFIKAGEAGKGPRVIKVYASVNAFLAFCNKAKINPDSKARSMFAAFLHRMSDKNKN